MLLKVTVRFSTVVWVSGQLLYASEAGKVSKTKSSPSMCCGFCVHQNPGEGCKAFYTIVEGENSHSLVVCVMISEYSDLP